MFQYYYFHETDEVSIQVTSNKEKPLSIRVSDEDENAMVNLSFDEIDRMIKGLEAAKQKILQRG